MTDETDTRKGIGMRIAAARTRKGLLQKDVAERFGIGNKAVSAWENGTSVPNAIQLRGLARLFGVSVDALLWEDSLSPEAMQIAAMFDSLTDSQQKMLRVLWEAYVREAVTDSQVEQHLPAPPEVQLTRR